LYHLSSCYPIVEIFHIHLCLSIIICAGDGCLEIPITLVFFPHSFLFHSFFRRQLVCQSYPGIPSFLVRRVFYIVSLGTAAFAGGMYRRMQASTAIKLLFSVTRKRDTVNVIYIIYISYFNFVLFLFNFAPLMYWAWGECSI